MKRTTGRGVSISPDGTVEAYIGTSTVPTQLGQLQLARFVNKAGLSSLGDNLFIDTPASGPAQISVPNAEGTGNLLQGYLDRSNVNSVTEIADLIAAQRAYEMNARVISGADEILQKEAELFTAAEYKSLAVYDRGGRRYPLILGRDELDFLAFWHEPRFAIVEVARPISIAALAHLSNHRPLVVACPTGAMAGQLYDTLQQRLLTLPAEVELYPGHTSGSACGAGMSGKPMSTLGFEKRSNPMLSMGRDEFVTALTETIPPRPAEMDRMIAFNLGQ